MHLADAEDLAFILMEDNGLESWSFRFDNAKRRCGACFHVERTIQLSRHYVELNGEDDVRDTILHEVAHALTGPGHGHDAKWKRTAREIGANPQRCADVAMPEGNVKGVCGPRCPARHTRHRMPPKHQLHGWRCNRCYESITWVRVK